MWAYLSHSYEGQYRALANQRKKLLNNFLEELLESRELYKDRCFVAFFQSG
jgi:hypothetical protein